MRGRSLILLGALAAFLIPSAVYAQAADPNEGVLVRVSGDVTVGADEDIAVVVVVDGNLAVESDVDTVVVVRGTVDVGAATLQTLVVVDGVANLNAGAVVDGDVWVPSTDLNVADDAVIRGDVATRVDVDFTGLWVLGIILAAGVTVAMMLAALLVAALAPGAVRRAGRALSSEIGPTLLAALVLWLAVPIVGALVFVTIVGIPTALAIWLVLLPVMAIIGYIVSATKVGELVMGRSGPERSVGRPLAAAAVGVLILQVVGLIPVLGGVVLFLAVALGGGAAALTLWRALGTPSGFSAPAEPAGT